MEIKCWDHLRSVLAVSLTGSFRAAAEMTGLSSMTIGRHIETLENELGQPIFVLKNKRWQATALGESLARSASGFESELALAMRANVESGHLFDSLEISTISYINAEFLAKHLDLWTAKNPGSCLEINASDDSVAVEEGKLDAAIRLAKPNQIGLMRQKIAISPVGLFATDPHGIQDWIGLPRALDPLPEMQMATRYFGRPPCLRLDSYQAVANAAIETGMPCLLPTCIVSDVTGLRRIGPPGVTPETIREVWLLFHERRKLDPAILALKAWIREIFPSTNRCLCGGCADLEPAAVSGLVEAQGGLRKP